MFIHKFEYIRYFFRKICRFMCDIKGRFNKKAALKHSKSRAGKNLYRVSGDSKEHGKEKYKRRVYANAKSPVSAKGENCVSQKPQAWKIKLVSRRILSKSILLRKRKKIQYTDKAKTAGGGKISFGLRHGLSNFTRIRVWKSRLSKSEACDKSNSRVSIRARCHMVSESNAVPLTHSLCARLNALTRRVYKKTRRDGKNKNNPLLVFLRRW